MSLTDAEILQLEELMEEQESFERRKSLTVFNDLTSPNYKALYNAINGQKWGKDETGKPVLLEGHAGYVLEGSSRSTKTFSGSFIILYLALIKHPKGCTINIYRETYNEFKTTLYDDFKRILDMFQLDNPFNRAKEISSFKIGKSKIHFLGDGKHGGGCDYAFFNEAMMIDESVFNQVKMRCRKFWWMDYNPSFTDHWVFDRVIPRNDVGFLRTTFKDNPFIAPNELNEILITEPWESGSYEVTDDGVLLYLGQPITEKNQPPPHKVNIAQGTADEFYWKVYGLGVRGAMKGVIFPYVTYIDSFPNLANTYGMDFGFTCFVGDTLIRTDKGDIKIKDIKQGDNVLTRKGYRKVLTTFDNGIKRVITKRIGLDFGYRNISATFNHNFNVNGKWKHFGQLTDQDILCTLSSFKGESINDTQTENSQTTTSINTEKREESIRKGYIMLFMNFLKVKFQKTPIFIMSILTLLIITPIIWLLSLLANTLKYIRFWRHTCKQINLLRTEKGTDTVRVIGKKGAKKYYISLVGKCEPANHAAPNIRQPTHIKNSVIKNAIIDGSIKQRLIKLRCNAKHVIRNSWETSILNLKHVVINAHIDYQQITDVKTISKDTFERVYDLHIEGVHEYFANGVLVHNCDPLTNVKYAREGRNIYLELLIYKPIETVEEVDATLKALKISKYVPITADSSDKYVSERRGAVKMVSELYDLGWEIEKVSKTKNVMYWLLDMKKYKIHIVKNHLVGHAKKEQENYIYKEVNGILINQPNDKYNHFWDGARYAHMSHESNNITSDWS